MSTPTSPVGLPGPPANALTMVLAFNASIVVEVLLYGIQFVLFCICMYILTRDQRSTSWFISVSAFVMFVLSTADVAISIRLMTRDFFTLLGPNGVQIYVDAAFPKGPIFVANNFIAELILLYRCYIIWDRSKYLLLGASLLVIGDSIWGLLVLLTSHSEFVPVYKWSVFAINMVLTAITVWRIFWVSQIDQSWFDGQILRHYRTMIAIFIETSAIYSACMLGHLLFPVSPYRLVMGSICVRMVTIMPTLLIVQLGLGRIIRETVKTTDCDAPTTSVILDSFAVSINAEEGNAIPVVTPRSLRPIHEVEEVEDQHGVTTVIDSRRTSLPSRPKDNTPVRS